MGERSKFEKSNREYKATEKKFMKHLSVSIFLNACKAKISTAVALEQTTKSAVYVQTIAIVFLSLTSWLSLGQALIQASQRHIIYKILRNERVIIDLLVDFITVKV